MTVFRFLLLTLLVIQLGACSNNDSNELIELDKIQKSSIESTPSDDEIDVYSYVSISNAKGVNINLNINN
jgi:hypothetical protein